MEIRINQHGDSALSTKVFFSDENGFEVASVIVLGQNDAVLIDAQWTLSNAHRVIAEILETGKLLKTIYITHAHPDHYFGLGTVAEAFPEARVTTIPSVARTINKQFFGKIEHWEKTIGFTNTPRKVVNLESLDDNFIELEGQRIEIIPEIMGDLKYNTVVWIPSIKVACATDVAFHDCHLWPIESNVERRVKWRDSIAQLREFDARIVIPGHCDAEKIRLMEEVQENESLSYTECIDWSLQYLDNYEEVYNTAKTGAEMVGKMTGLYPDVKAEDFAIHWQTRLLFPHSSPDWLTPLPGEPGKIFLKGW